MNARNLQIAAVLLVGFALPSIAGATERGTLKNNTPIRIVYQAGYADEKGFVSWQTYSLAPGQSHVWTVHDPRRRPLHLQWDLNLGDGKYTPTRNGLPTRPNGCLSAFFLFGRQVWIDTSGGAR
ncbi:MAG: hypothetical protein HYX68_00725 [Planctomycetes bacterium]|nr:hypothetical protein [Planctomycetota bacterium]